MVISEWYPVTDVLWVILKGLGAVAVSASEQLRRVVRLSPAEINAEAANQRESLNGARAGSAQIYDYLTFKEGAAAPTN